MKGQETAFAIFRLLEVPGIGPARLSKVLALAEETGASLPDLIDDPARISSVITQEQIFAIRANAPKNLDVWRELTDLGVNMVSLLDPDYPKSMKSLLGKQAPPLLFVLGNKSLLERRSLGFCGSRKASEKGLAVARECAEIVSREGINVVSGYAAGVDMATHRAALGVGGTTTLVLADGIRHFRLKQELKVEWDWSRAAVVSQYSPGLTWSVHNAMVRNLTICALCKAMVLIEARESGGSIEAGRACLRLGIPLFAPVYEGMPESASGNRLLLAEGARSLYKNKSTNLPNLRSLLAAFSPTEGSLDQPRLRVG
jgi:DNA processing protein